MNSLFSSEESGSASNNLSTPSYLGAWSAAWTGMECVWFRGNAEPRRGQLRTESSQLPSCVSCQLLQRTHSDQGATFGVFEKRKNVRRPETGSAVPGFPSVEKMNSGNHNITGFNPRPNREWFRNRPLWRLRKRNWALPT